MEQGQHCGELQRVPCSEGSSQGACRGDRKSKVLRCESVLCKDPSQNPVWLQQSSPGGEEQQVLRSEGCRELVPGNPWQVLVTLLEMQRTQAGLSCSLTSFLQMVQILSNLAQCK